VVAKTPSIMRNPMLPIPFVLTCPRPTPTIGKTLESLKGAGFDCEVFDGSPPPGQPTNAAGCTAAYIRLLRHADNVLGRRPAADSVIIFEDDVVSCRGLREYLEAIPWPESPHQIAMVSSYCPTAYSNYDTFGRWHREDRRVTLAGTQCFIYPRHAIALIADYIKPDRLNDDGRPLGVDVQMGWLARDTGLHVYYHVPSLLQHTGVYGNSAVGYYDCGTIYHAETFVGEEFDARSLL
jgi:hypothetical protein